MQLTFWGAAQQVTGSMHLLELADGYRVLIDCGLDLEPDRVPPQEVFPFDPTTLDAVVLTHAHLDHCGHIPNLVRYGFMGRVHCTYATFELARLLLFDSARLNERDLRRYDQPEGRRRGRGRGQGRKKPSRFARAELFDQYTAEDALNVFACHEPGDSFELRPGLRVDLLPAGHLLGAVHAVFTVTENGTTRKLAFSGDVGRQGYPLLPDPAALPEVDYLVTETTYGNRVHRATEAPEVVMERIIRETCVEQPGRLIIPAFSVGRTQALLYVLHRLHRQGRLPAIRIFADSPLALQSTQVYARYHEDMNAEARAFAEEYGGLFDFEQLQYVANMKQSAAVNNYQEPCIIIASSGMVEGGRITQHIQTNLENPYATLFFIGYCAPGTFGHELLHGRDHYRRGGEEVRIQANIQQTDVFSGHGDMYDLLRLAKFTPPDHLRRIFLVHGDPTAMQEYRDTLAEQGYSRVAIPYRGQTFELE